MDAAGHARWALNGSLIGPKPGVHLALSGRDGSPTDLRTETRLDSELGHAMPTIVLVDNGSSRPDSTRTLRRIAAALGERLGVAVDPVSVQHSDQVPANQLDGQGADTFEPYLRRALAGATRDFLILPLFFGPSAALTRFIPETAAKLESQHGPFRLHVAPELCPMPMGEPRLAEILAHLVYWTAERQGIEPRRVVLVDHGSPSRSVSAVRTWVAEGLRRRLSRGVEVLEAAMERRPGIEYDFNGELLETVLTRFAQQDPRTPIILAMLFMAPGRHAGPGGDIADICGRVKKQVPELRIYPTPMVGEHPGLIDILALRAWGAIGSANPQELKGDIWGASRGPG